MIKMLRKTFDELPDYRTGKNVTYAITDAAVGAFSVFFTQSASFLAHQRDMQTQKGKSNASSLFGIEKVPTDPQIRNLLDPISPAYLSEPFWTIYAGLESAGYLDGYRGFADNYLCGLDGTQTFSSQKIQCAHCSTHEHNGTTTYSHTALTPVLTAPGQKQVIALEPEFILPQDGHEKQDCEQAAAKRWVLRNASRFPRQRVTILADDLYCHQPFCALLLAQHMNFILVCKPDSHVALYEEVALLNKIGGVCHLSFRQWNGRFIEVWQCRYAHHVPLRRGADALYVNWCEITISREDSGERLYHNAFATNHTLSEQTVKPILTAGRTRWKIENENNNVLKNYGYHLEHNYGHGQQFLASILILLNLLAFLMHTVLDFIDDKYRLVRQALVRRDTFFADLRALTRYLYFTDWDHLLNFMVVQLELEPDSG
jgi:hypothetical protein